MISGDGDEAGYQQTIKDSGFFSLPLKSDIQPSVEARFKCTGYPTPIILNGATGEIIDPDAYGKTDL